MESLNINFKKIEEGVFAGDVIAFFNDHARYDPKEKKTYVKCYQLGAGEGEADISFMLYDCIPANPEEYAKLKDELENITGSHIECAEYDPETTVIYTAYSAECDMTFIMEEIASGMDALSTECVGWYYGKPNQKNTEAYIGKLKAQYDV